LPPDPDGGAYSAPPDFQLDFRGLLLKEGRAEKGRVGEGRGPPALQLHPSHYIVE